MTEKIVNIAKNTSYFTIALIMQKVVSFSYFTILARNFNPEDLGKYYFAVSFTTIFAIFIDLGFANLLTREIAKDNNRSSYILYNVLILKIPLAILTLLCAIIFVNILGYPEITKQLVYLSSICMVLDSFTLTFFSLVRGFHNLLYESISSVIFQLVVLFSGIIFIKLNFSLGWMMGALSLASIFNFLYSFLLLKVKLKINFKQKFDAVFAKSFFILALPFAAYGILQRLFTYFDSVLLSIMVGDKYVGLYQIAFKIIFALQFLPLAFTASLYPAFSKYFKDNKEQLIVSFERAMNYLIIISLSIRRGILTLADKIILLFKAEYLEAVFPLQIIIIAIIFIFLNYPIGSLLNACDRQKQNTLFMSIGLISSIALNLVLIPIYKTTGASLTVVISNFIIFIIVFIYSQKIIKFKMKNIFITLLKSSLSVLVMAGVIILLKDYINIFVLILVSGIIYFISLYIFRGFKSEDISSIIDSFRRKDRIDSEEIT